MRVVLSAWGRTVVILEQGLGDANESPLLKRHAVVVGEDTV